jgi:hypothetical protein
MLPGLETATTARWWLIAVVSQCSEGRSRQRGAPERIPLPRLES